MTPEPTYLDYAATAPVRPEAAEAVSEALAAVGNPSSVHAAGRRARNIVEKARATLADAVSASRVSVIFTSGATEANVTALTCTGAKRLVVSAVEHDSVLAPAAQSGLPMDIVDVDSNGVVDLVALEQILGTDADGTLVSLMLANNETGVIQPVSEAAQIAKRAGARIHCDAVQALGKLPLDMGALGIDTMSLSAHKMGGPPGIGALIARDPATLQPLITGGGQERNHRAGTENVAGIAGFGAAIQALAEDPVDWSSIAGWRDTWEAKVQAVAPDAVVFGQDAPRLPGTSNVAMPGVTGETQVMALDLAGICVSSGSACSSGKVKTSHVLEAMGACELAGSSIRVSLGWASRESDLDSLFEAWLALYQRTQQRQSS